MSWLTLIIPVVLGAAVVGGLLVRRFHLRGRNRDHPLAGLEGLSVSELVVPARTGQVLILLADVGLLVSTSAMLG